MTEEQNTARSSSPGGHNGAPQTHTPSWLEILVRIAGLVVAALLLCLGLLLGLLSQGNPFADAPPYPRPAQMATSAAVLGLGAAIGIASLVGRRGPRS